MILSFVCLNIFVNLENISLFEIIQAHELRRKFKTSLTHSRSIHGIDPKLVQTGLPFTQIHFDDKCNS